MDSRGVQPSRLVIRIASRSHITPIILLLCVPATTATGCDDTEFPPFPEKSGKSSAAGIGHGGASTVGSGGSLLSGGTGGSSDGGAESPVAGSTSRGLANEAGSSAITAGGSGTAGATMSLVVSGAGGDAPLGEGGTDNSSGGFVNAEGGMAPTMGGSLSEFGGGPGSLGGTAGAAGGLTGGIAGTTGMAGSPTTSAAGSPGAGMAGFGAAGAATGGAATGGTATGGTATGGAATGGAATGGAPNCDSAPSIKACGGKCVDISSDAHHCRACGHDCGYGSSCVAGQCQSVLVYAPSATITAFEADDTNIVFSPTGIQACSAEGCALSPGTVSSYSPGAERFLANGYVLVQIPNVGATGRYTGYGLCPTTGCTTSNMIGFGETNQQVSFYSRTASAHNFFRSMKTPVGSSVSYCASPVATGCTTISSYAVVASSTLVVSDSAVFFSASIGGTEATLYACGLADLSSCTPTAVNLPATLMPVTRVMAAYGDDLYFYQPGGAPPNTIPTLRKCPRTGCGTSMGTLLGQLSSPIDELEIDASGVYWFAGNTVKMCPLAGCVGAPLDVATGIDAPSMLRLNTGYVYWVNTTNNAIYRVAKPAL